MSVALVTIEGMKIHQATTTTRDTRSRGAVLGELERTRARIAALQADELALLARADAIAAEMTARVPSTAGRERRSRCGRWRPKSPPCCGGRTG